MYNMPAIGVMNADQLILHSYVAARILCRYLKPMFSKLAAAYADQKYYHIRAGAPRITTDSATTAAAAVAAVITSDDDAESSSLSVSTEAPDEYESSDEYAVPVKFYTADVDSIPGLIATESQHPYAASATRCVYIIACTSILV
jgi:hypothetical protein